MKTSIVNIVILMLIMLWVYTAVSKLADMDLFVTRLQQQPLPVWSVAYLKWLLPASELIIALFLSIEKTRSAGLLFSFVLLTVFAAYVALALSGAYGRIPCSCGGVFTFFGWKGHLVFNTSAAALAFVAWRLNKNLISNKTIIKHYAHSGKEAENP